MSSFLTPLNPSMKVPPKRKGNAGGANCRTFTHTLNESPSEKEGKFTAPVVRVRCAAALNESPSEKEGKIEDH